MLITPQRYQAWLWWSDSIVCQSINSEHVADKGRFPTFGPQIGSMEYVVRHLTN